MSTNNHTDITTGAAANASTINTPLGDLDAAIGNRASLTTTATGSLVLAVNEVDAHADTAQAEINTARGGYSALNDRITATESEVQTARGGYGSLDGRLDALVVSGGVTATTLSLSSSTGAVSLTVVSITGFALGNPITVELDDGTLHATTIDQAPAGNTIHIADALPVAAGIGNAVSMTIGEVIDARGTYATLGTRLREYPGVMQLSANCDTATVALPLDHLTSELPSDFYVWVDAYTTGCEVRRVTGFDGSGYPQISALSSTHAQGDLVLWSPEPVASFEMFGGGAAASAATNIAAGIRAAAQLSAVNGVLKLNAIYPVSITSDTAVSDTVNTFTVSASMAILGNGPAVSGFSSTAAGTFAVIQATGSGTVLDCRDFSIAGAVTWTTESQTGIEHNGNLGVLRLRNIKLSGLRTGAKYDGVSKTVAGDMYISECELSGCEVDALHTGVAGALISKDSYYHDSDTTSSNSHGIYCNVEVDLSSSHDRFRNLTGFGITHSGSSDPTPASCTYSIIDHPICEGDESATPDYRSGINTHNAVRTVINHPTLISSYIINNYDAEIDKITASGTPPNAQAFVTSATTGTDLTINGGHLTVASSTGKCAVIPGADIGTWRLRDLEIYGGATDGNGISTSTFAGALLVERLHLEGDFTYGVYSNSASMAVTVTDSTLRLNTAGGSNIYMQNCASLNIWRNVFGGGATTYAWRSVVADKVFGGDNYYENYGPYATVTCREVGRRMMAVSAVASSASIELPALNFEFFDISGTANIDNFYITPASAAYANILYCGTFYTRWTDATPGTSTTGGNLVPLKTTNRSQNEIARWRADPVANKIYEF